MELITLSHHAVAHEGTPLQQGAPSWSFEYGPQPNLALPDILPISMCYYECSHETVFKINGVNKSIKSLSVDSIREANTIARHLLKQLGWHLIEDCKIAGQLICKFRLVHLGFSSEVAKLRRWESIFWKHASERTLKRCWSRIRNLNVEIINTVLLFCTIQITETHSPLWEVAWLSQPLVSAISLSTTNRSSVFDSWSLSFK